MHAGIKLIKLLLHRFFFTATMTCTHALTLYSSNYAMELKMELKMDQFIIKYLSKAICGVCSCMGGEHYIGTINTLISRGDPKFLADLQWPVC